MLLERKIYAIFADKNVYIMKYVDLNGLGKFLQGIKEMFSNYLTIRENEENEKVVAAFLNELKETKQDVIEDLDEIRDVSSKVGDLSELQTKEKDSVVSSLNSLVGEIENNEKVVSSALNENKEKIAELTALDHKVGDVKNLMSSGIIPYPTTPVIIRVTSDFPSQKGDRKVGTANITFDDRIIDCGVALDIQGQSSTRYDKKNLSLKLLNEGRDFSIKIGSFVPSADYVWKANYIDRTQCRNLTSNRIWGEIASGHCTANDKKGYVDGVPAILYVNNEFYGIGNLNIGKTMANYISNTLVQADDHINFAQHNVSVFKEISEIFDEQLVEDFYTYFGDECLKIEGSKETVSAHVDIKNFINYYIFIEFLYADDDVDKNFIIGRNTDGKIVFFPYDLDSTFGLWCDGYNVSFKSGSVLDSSNVKGYKASDVWKGFYALFKSEVNSRYAELRRSGVLTSHTVYAIASELFYAFTNEYRAQESERWDFSGVANGDSVGYFAEWTENRIEVLDKLFSYSTGGNASISQILDDILGDEDSDEINELLDTILGEEISTPHS